MTAPNLSHMNDSCTTPFADCDILVIGSGAAGLTVALRSAAKAKVTVLSKGDLNQGATFYAQGGIAAVLDPADSVTSHVEDTIEAGAGLCSRPVVEQILSRSTEAVDWLLQQGVPFTRQRTRRRTRQRGRARRSAPDISTLHLTQEGGHSHRRIIHATDATGKAVFETLRRRAEAHPNIRLVQGYTAMDLIVQGGVCVGAYLLEQRSGRVLAAAARCVVLATGGASKVYLYTSNPDGASGDGIAMAWRAGCRVADLEFNQFHPTCLFHPHPEARSFLITEALRGEGARLQLPDGSRFMPDYDPRAELAPRDIVARAIDHEMKRLGCDCVFLDISHRPARFIRRHFPSVYRRCLGFGMDITRQRIPVVPAAHYTCGGVMVDTAGRSDIPGLYAVGETAFTGLHGANRIASNSLLECFVVAFGAAEHITKELTTRSAERNRSPLEGEQAKQGRKPAVERWGEPAPEPRDEVLISHNWDEIRRCMWNFVGIVRNDSRLHRARRRLQLVAEEVQDYYRSHPPSSDLLELRNLTLVARLVVESALRRKESRGLHYSLDHPQTNPTPQTTILTPTDDPLNK